MIVVYFLLMMIPIVIIHELGHLYIGRLSGIRAEVFSVGFGKPLFSIDDKHGTNWRFSPIPLGGYVRFAPDANGTGFPNVDTDKPPYQAPFIGKMATILAGPFANFIFSFLLFTLFALFNGTQGSAPIVDTVSIETGLETGDLIRSVDGEPIDSILDLYTLSAEAGATLALTAERDGQLIDLEIPNLNQPYILFLIPGLPAAEAGLVEGDLVKSVNGAPIATVQELIDAIRENGAQEMVISFERDGETQDVTLTPDIQSDDVPRIGANLGIVLSTAPERRGLIESARYAQGATVWILTQSFDGLRDLIVGDVSVKALSGPVGIANVAQDAASGGFWQFVQIMALISSAIGFMNLLPIPILDGGHIVLMGYERLFGRLPPQIVINFLFALGIALLLGVLVFTTSNELFG